MARIGSRLPLLFVLAAASAAAASYAAEPKVTVVVQPNPVAVDDSLQMRVETVVEGGGDVSPPSFDAPEFTVVGKGSSSSFSTIYEGGNLQTQQRKLWTFVLAPKREGVHKISNISVFVGGREIRSHDIAVKVLPGTSTPTSPPDASMGEEGGNPAAPGQFQSGGEGVHPTRFNSDFTVFLRLSKKQVYAGEPVVAEYYIYSPGGIQQIEIKKWPSFNGFWKEDLEIPSRYEWEPVYAGGRRMLRVLVGKFALYPIKPGKIKVDQLLISARYVDRSRTFDEEDVFNLPQIFGNVRVGTHSSGEETIEVLPLPEAGRPEGFSGAVGQFRINLTADKKQAPANSPVNFEFTVEGTGNFHAIEAPKLGFPKDFELYEAKASFQLGTPIGVARRLENKKSFQYLVLPRKEGAFTIPSFRFSWFDVASRSYKTASTEAIALEITPDKTGGGGANNNYLSEAAPADGKSTAPKEPELRFLKPWNEPDVSRYFRFAIIALLALNAALAVMLAVRRTSPRSWVERLSQSPRRRLATLLAEARRSQDHYGSLEKSLYGAMEILLGRSALGMTRDEMTDAWKERQLPPALLHKIHSLFDAADRARFAGGGKAVESATVQSHLQALRDVIEESIRLVK